MATVHQKWQGDSIALGNVGDSEVRTQYVIRDAPDEWSAWVALNLATLTPPEGIAIGDERLVRRQIRITDRLGNAIWDGEVDWGPRQTIGELIRQDGFKWTVETAGGTTKIIHARETRAYGDSGSVEWESNLIHDGDGIDVTHPQLRWTETWEFDAAAITFDYVNILHQLTGTVNANLFRGFFDPGEVLFLGAAGGKQSQSTAQISYSFAAEPNAGSELGRPDEQAGDALVTKKHGHEYLEVLLDEEETDGSELGGSARIAKRAHFALVHQVYPFADFSALLIGT